jgi:hypothetical protein
MKSFELIIRKSIVLSACLFGSLYLFSTSLIGLNKKWLKNQQVSLYELVNGTILILSGTVMIRILYKDLPYITHIKKV